MKKIVLVLLAGAALLETVSGLFVYAAGRWRPDWRLDMLLEHHFAPVDEAYVATALPRHDALLGWDNPPSSRMTALNSAGRAWTASYGPDGARNDGADRGPVVIATFGDSFTHCDEVDDTRTWQYFLEKLENIDVKNFGVSAFGAGQALLKMERKFRAGLTARINLFVIYTADLNRVVNTYRFFLNGAANEKLTFKPSYRYLGGKIRFRPNPWPDPSMPVGDIEALAFRLAHEDFWMGRWLLVEPDFPFSGQGLKVIRYAAKKVQRSILKEKPIDTLWETTEGIELMKYLVAKFVGLSKAHGAVPVVFFVPRVSRWRDGRVRPAYADFRSNVLPKLLPDLAVIDLYDAEFDERRFNIRPFAGHASPYGNETIARFLSRRLRELKLLP